MCKIDMKCGTLPKHECHGATNRSEKFWESPQKPHLRALYVLIRKLEGQNSGFIGGLDLALRESRARLREVRARQWSEATSKRLICFNQAAVGPKPGFYKGSRFGPARVPRDFARGPREAWSEPTSKSLSLARESRIYSLKSSWVLHVGRQLAPEHCLGSPMCLPVRSELPYERLQNIPRYTPARGPCNG